MRADIARKFFGCLALLLAIEAWAAVAAGVEASASNGTVTGMVFNAATGAAIPDVQVFARSGTKRVEAVTDAKGHYSLRDLPAGSFLVRAYSGPHLSGSRAVTLSAGQELSSIDFNLRPHGAISGKVVDQNKEPVPEISVLLVAREYQLGVLRNVYAGYAQTNDRGEYRMDDVPPGRGFFLMAKKQIFKLPAISDAPAEVALRKKVSVPTWYPNTAEIAGAEVITLRPGEQREGMDMQIIRSPSYCLDGVLETPSGPGVLNFGIEEQEPRSGKSGDGAMILGLPGGQTGKDGRMRICDLHPGAYALIAFQSPKDQKSSPPFYAGTTVQIGNKDVHNVHARSAARMAVPGEVVWAGKAPEQAPAGKLSMRLELIGRAPWMGEWEGLHAESPVPGQFSFPALAVDEYSVDVQGVPADLYVKDISYAGLSILHQPMGLGGSVGTPELRVVMGTDGGVVTARVADKDGHPVPDSHVLILPEDTSSDAALTAALVSGQTDQNGLYSSAHLTPGKYRVLASLDEVDRTPESAARIRMAREQAAEVELGANASVTVSLSPVSLQ